METWLAVWLASTMLFVIVARLKLFISLAYRRRGEDDRLAIDVYALRKIVNYHLEVPLARISSRDGLPWPEAVVDTPDGQTETHAGAEQRYVRNTWKIFRHHPRHWHRLMKQFRYYTRIYKQLAAFVLATVTCEKLSWRTKLGTGDAALTGVTAGLAWQMKAQVYAFMQKRLKSVARPVFRVSPLYAREGVEIELECIFSIRLGNVINAITTAIQQLGRGDDRQWKNTRSKV
ncbi:DUF2953 domain-containing protein [Anaeroselena agilis]|uniref:DUF2953 domain-containing protein n=1 Tax=Anaeroselena agilis TaxID=3063788 RepID=A0ABU3NXY5_9FIRM|nr:DUF2953 domain-containing protein [Selenomonadales bacterium 4137-cl]